MVPSPVVQMDPSQEAQGPMVPKKPTLMFQYPVVPETCNLVEPHPKLPTSPVVSVLVKESVTVRVPLPETPVNPVTPKKGSHVSRAISSEPVLVPDPEACPECYQGLMSSLSRQLPGRLQAIYFTLVFAVLVPFWILDFCSLIICFGLFIVLFTFVCLCLLCCL